MGIFSKFFEILAKRSIRGESECPSIHSVSLEYKCSMNVKHFFSCVLPRCWLKYSAQILINSQTKS